MVRGKRIYGQREKYLGSEGKGFRVGGNTWLDRRLQHAKRTKEKFRYMNGESWSVIES